ncbi:MAG: heme exporter protein CcmD [Burkholderiales bacterium]|nr:heme exporter protein CcmD [Burkholderiales bacterium]
MTDHEVFILGSYGVTAIVLALELLWLRLSAKRRLEALREARQMEGA